jgi:UDP-N-acetylmuramoylalanine--D-glutamate ligase
MSRSLAGETIGILGLARSGLAAARLALSRGAKVYASDAGDSESARAAAEEVRALGGDAETGGHDLEKLGACTRIVLSPGIPPTARVLREEAIQGVPVVPEIELAFGQLECPVIGITGTNGKTTVTSLIEHLLRGAGIDAMAGGNIGTALSELALREPQPAWAVAEVSSFQLSGIRAFSPVIGILTNLAPDHLDWYDDVEDYYADKARLFVNAGPESRWILNAEDERARDLIGTAPGTRFYFRVETPPESEEELGGWLSTGQLLVRTEPGVTETVGDAADLQILGPHNVANALAASIAARLAGATAVQIADALRTFRAPAHRLEPVGEVDGVLWINDSKATNIASTRVAIRGMARPTVLLLGGKHKGEPYTELLPDLEGRVKTVIAYGEAAPLIEADLQGRAPVERVDGPFEAVVDRARQVATSGDAVLLSPACSSFDMFRNYEERGRRFCELAREGQE